MTAIALEAATARLDSALGALTDYFIFIEPLRPMPSELDGSPMAPEQCRPCGDGAAYVIEHAAREVECLPRRIVINRTTDAGFAE